VLFDSTFVDARPVSTRNWFNRMSNLDSITGISNLNTSLVTDMRRMFAGCQSLKVLDLSDFDTSHATDMAGMFTGCGSLTSLDLSSFNTQNVRYMGWMFVGCPSMTTLDLGGMNTSNVTEMEYMFQGCVGLTLLDLSYFNTNNVRNMEAMFNGCSHLRTIHASNSWRTDAVIESSKMFAGCSQLVGGEGTAFDENQVDAARAHIDGGTSDPGYLTGKIIIRNGDVNADGEVNIADVNCLISVIQGDSDTYEGRADVNADGEVTIADINSVIDIIVGGTTPTPPTPPDQEYVDLGLPSGTLWATCNVGANSPEEIGDSFAWGETRPKDYYSWSTYKWCNGETNMTKYSTEVDNKTELDPEDDAATVNRGPQWRTPTQEQLQELVEQCTWTYLILNGVGCCQATGPNGNSIFFPLSGDPLEDYYLGFGHYWSRTLYNNSQAYFLSLMSGNFKPYTNSYGSRSSGINIRPVRVQ